MNDNILVETVRKYQYLSEPEENKYFHDNLQKKNTWDEVCTSVQYSASECKNKFTSLWDNFRKVVKRRKSNHLLAHHEVISLLNQTSQEQNHSLEPQEKYLTSLPPSLSSSSTTSLSSIVHEPILSI